MAGNRNAIFHVEFGDQRAYIEKGICFADERVVKIMIKPESGERAQSLLDSFAGSNKAKSCNLYDVTSRPSPASSGFNFYSHVDMRNGDPGRDSRQTRAAPFGMDHHRFRAAR